MYIYNYPKIYCIYESIRFEPICSSIPPVSYFCKSLLEFIILIDFLFMSFEIEFSIVVNVLSSLLIKNR